jgi:Concanavalin A-like lectin/glucanases superfamily
MEITSLRNSSSAHLIAVSENPVIKGLLAAICIALLCVVLYAGLKPFGIPANEVTWVSNANAVRFGRYGTILSLASFPLSDLGDGDRSLEIWLQPALVRDSNTFAAFYDPGKPRQLWLRQSERDLELRIESSAAWRHETTAKMYVDEAFRDGANRFWAVTSGSMGTAIYRDGVKVKESRKLHISREELTGRLVIGGSPIFNESWSGVLRGFAIYDRALTPAQIVRHFRTWTKGTRPELTADDACIALYVFDEHSGRVIHNKIGSGNDLYIPDKYLVLNQTVLDPIWRAFNWSRGFWKDAFINLGGFIPVAFLFCAYLSAAGFGLIFQRGIRACPI